MSRGPCLCGDPYCSSCGTLALAETEAAEEALLNKLAEAKLSSAEYEIMLEVGLTAVNKHREALSEVTGAISANHSIIEQDMQYEIDRLRENIAALKKLNKQSSYHGV